MRYTINSKDGVASFQANGIDAVVIKKNWKFSRYSTISVSLKGGNIVQNITVSNESAKTHMDNLKQYIK